MSNVINVCFVHKCIIPPGQESFFYSPNENVPTAADYRKLLMEIDKSLNKTMITPKFQKQIQDHFVMTVPKGFEGDY